MTDHLGEFSDIWKKHHETILNQATALLITRLEKGFNTKDQEKGYREGLYALPTLYKECYKLVSRLQNKVNDNKKEEKRIEKLKRTSKMI